jgi:hypothetical protein
MKQALGTGELGAKSLQNFELFQERVLEVQGLGFLKHFLSLSLT